MLALVKHIRPGKKGSETISDIESENSFRSSRKLRSSRSQGDIKRERTKHDIKMVNRSDFEHHVLSAGRLNTEPPVASVGRSDFESTGRSNFESHVANNAEYKHFLDQYPGYFDTLTLDELRTTEYTRLDRLGHVYLDYTGGSLYPEKLIRKHTDILINGVFGNPHSSNPTSAASTKIEEQARRDVLSFFGADPHEYVVIFTSNASGALKIVGESYPFSEDRKLLLTWDAHNSVNGIREFASAKGSEIIYCPLEMEEGRISQNELEGHLDKHAKNKKEPGLFILTGQSNITGVKADLAWTRYARSCGWDVLLDASALAPTTPINLRKYPVDFMAISFYKMFGYPTGVGCLLMRREAEGKLRRPWFGGGTVDIVAVPHMAYTPSSGHHKFEDGTVNYLCFSAISLGLEFLLSIQKLLSRRITILTDYLIKELNFLRHKGTGQKLVSIAGPQTTHLRGGTLALTFHDVLGKPIPHLLVEREAKKRNISLRTGCMCNPGATTIARKRPNDLEHLKAFMTVDEFVESVEGEELVLLVRVSLGIATNWKDCAAFVNFCKEFLDPYTYESMREDYGDTKIRSLC